MRSKLAPLLWQRLAELALHVVLTGWLIGFIYQNIAQLYYVVAAAVLVAFYAICLVNCIKQVVTIKQLAFSDDVIAIQGSLVLLLTHIVNYVRVTFLAFTLWLAFPVVIMNAFTGFDMVAHLHGNWWIGLLVFSVVMAPVCFWLYQQVSYKNIHKRWAKFVIQQSSGKRVLKAMQLMKEVEAAKRPTLIMLHQCSLLNNCMTAGGG